jgi:hypothetical protein
VLGDSGQPRDGRRNRQGNMRDLQKQCRHYCCPTRSRRRKSASATTYSVNSGRLQPRPKLLSRSRNTTDRSQNNQPKPFICPLDYCNMGMEESKEIWCCVK